MIKTDKDYQTALERIMLLMDAKSGTSEGDESDIIATQVEVYEAKEIIIKKTDPIEAIRFRLEQYGLKDKDLVPPLGHSDRVSEVMNYCHKLTLPMIRKLHAGLNIPTESLAQDYALQNMG